MPKARKHGTRRTVRGSRKRRAKPQTAAALAAPAPAPAAAEADGTPPEPVDGRRARGPKAERSVEDPLGDWSGTDADRWLLDREGEGVEAPEE
jgi:hypothetical protein